MSGSVAKGFLLAALVAAGPAAQAQGLRAPAGAGLASEGLLSGYWEDGGLTGFLQQIPDDPAARPLVGGWSYAVSEDSKLSLGLGWQPGAREDELGYLGAAGASWRQRFYGFWDPVVTAGVSLLRQPIGDTGASGDVYGAHISVGLNPTHDWGLSLGFGYRDALRSSTFASPAERAEQRAVYGDLAAIYRLQRNFELQGQISGLDLRSNPLQEVNSAREVGLRMRYRFD